jgi:hypothetical protein
VPAKVGRAAGVVGERLEIGNKDCLIVLILEAQPAAQGAGEVAQVERARGTIPSEDYLALRRSWS